MWWVVSDPMDPIDRPTKGRAVTEPRRHLDTIINTWVLTMNEITKTLRLVSLLPGREENDEGSILWDCSSWEGGMALYIRVTQS